MTVHQLIRHAPPAPLRPDAVELHMLGCDCPACEPYRPSVPPRLGARQIAGLAIDGVILALIVASLLFGPAAVARLLLAALTGSAL